MEYVLDQIIKTKKQHVCGSKEWRILRVGVDIRLKCMGCGREIIMLRHELNKRVVGSKSTNT